MDWLPLNFNSGPGGAGDRREPTLGERTASNCNDRARTLGCAGTRYSALIPAEWITLVQRLVSSASSLPISCGLIPDGSAPCAASRSLTSGGAGVLQHSR